MRGPSFRSTAFLIPVLTLAAPALLAAQAPTVTLSKPEAEFGDPFDQVTAVRELRDGRVIVSDVFAKQVSVVDLQTGSATAIGREGQGPGEYAFPSGLVALPGDTTLIADPAQRRFLKIAPDLKPVGTIPFPDGVGMVMVKGADRQGRLYFQGSPFRGGPLGGRAEPDAEIPDSVSVLRWSPAAKKVDSLGRVKIASIARASSGGANARAIVMRPQPYSPADDWSVTPDGRVGVARVSDYHIEWLGTSKVAGPPVRAERVPVSKGDKDAYNRQGQDPRGRLMVSVGGAPRGGGGGAPVAPPQLPDPDWPEFKPPFVANSVVAAPDGQLWVSRSQPAGAGPLYDVFDAQGRLAKQVRLEAGSRLVGFGATSVYVAKTDEDDLQRLQRFRRP